MSMIQLDRFDDDRRLKKIAKSLNKHLEEGKEIDALGYKRTLMSYIEDKHHLTKVSYLLSTIAEYFPYFLSESDMDKILSLMESVNEKVHINLTITMGYYLLGSFRKKRGYYEFLTETLANSTSEDIHDTVIYFLSELSEQDVKFSLTSITQCITALSEIYDDENKDILTSILSKQPFCILDHERIFSNIQGSISSQNKIVANRFPLCRYMNQVNFSLRDFFREYRRIYNKSKTIPIFLKAGPQIEWTLFEFDRDTIDAFFTEPEPITFSKIIDYFSEAIHTRSKPLIRFIMRQFIQQQALNGYFSLIGNYYSQPYLVLKLNSDLDHDGKINVKKYGHFPPGFVKKCLEQVTNTANDTIVRNKNDLIFYRFSKFYQQIEHDSHSQPLIDMEKYNNFLGEKDFCELVQKCVDNNLILNGYHYSSKYLTITGKNTIINKFETSKEVGYFHAKKVARKLKIPIPIITDIIFEQFDKKSGLFSRDGTIIYFNTYISDMISHYGVDKVAYVLSSKLRLPMKKVKDYIKSHQDSLIYEILHENMEYLSLSTYCGKLGIEQEALLSFLDDKKIPYLKQGDRVLFRSTRINEEKDKIKQKIIDKAKRKDTFELRIRQFKLPEAFLHDTLKELQKDHVLRGIIHRHKNSYYFYSEQTIEEMLLKNSYQFNLKELFPEKIFNKLELDLIENIIKKLEEDKKLKGRYNTETKTFISEDLTHAAQYDDIVNAAIRKGRRIILHFKNILERIKQILVNTEEQITPNQIALMEEIMNKMVKEQKKWCDEFDAFIADKSTEMKRDILKEPSVQRVRERIFSYRYVINKLSVSYNSILYYQRLYIVRKGDMKRKRRYFALLRKYMLLEDNNEDTLKSIK